MFAREVYYFRMVTDNKCCDSGNLILRSSSACMWLRYENHNDLGPRKTLVFSYISTVLRSNILLSYSLLAFPSLSCFDFLSIIMVLTKCKCIQFQ